MTGRLQEHRQLSAPAVVQGDSAPTVQQKIDAAYTANRQHPEPVVIAEPQNWETPIVVRRGVALLGPDRHVPGNRAWAQPLIQTSYGQGIQESAENPTHKPLIQLEGDAAIGGLTFKQHGHQPGDAQPYPYLIGTERRGALDNGARIFNIQTGPVYRLMYVASSKATIEHIYAHPLNVGMYAGHSRDCSTVNHVHFWQWGYPPAEWIAYTVLPETNLRLFVIADVDMWYFSNIFGSGAWVFAQFVERWQDGVKMYGRTQWTGARVDYCGVGFDMYTGRATVMGYEWGGSAPHFGAPFSIPAIARNDAWLKVLGADWFGIVQPVIAAHGGEIEHDFKKVH